MPQVIEFDNSTKLKPSQIRGVELYHESTTNRYLFVMFNDEKGNPQQRRFWYSDMIVLKIREAGVRVTKTQKR